MLLQYVSRVDSNLQNEVYLIKIHHSCRKLGLLENQPWKSAWSDLVLCEIPWDTSRILY